MPRQKRPFNRKQQSTVQAPNTANEQLAAGVQYEEAGEKWRAGDAQKASRFFMRAVVAYEEGLQKFPGSFDLAYNKARLEYDLAQQPNLLVHLPFSSGELLQLALISHRYALQLDRGNADLLFNTAQLLSSLAEAKGENTNPDDDQTPVPYVLFQEALGLLEKCLSMQELQFSQSLEQVNEDGQTPLNGSQNASSTSPKELENETWATVIEPTTQDTLLDTSIAQLEILTSICTHLSSAGDWYPNEIHWIRQWEQELIENKVARYLQGTNRHGEIELVRANLSCHLADAEFQAGRLDFYVYEHELVTAFSKVSEFEATFQGLCDRADAEIALNAAAQTVVEEANHRRPESALKLNVLRWKHLTTALDSLTAAVEVEGEPQLSQVHLRRGDCEMLRHRLADPPSDYELARKSEKTLLANAEIYYRGAARLASAAEIRQEASVKEAVAATISGQTEKLVTAKSVDAKGVQKVINNMEEEGLLSEEKYYWIGSL